jgi:biopolymer transport protein ExbB/biopolymer transport protein TolQ
MQLMEALVSIADVGSHVVLYLLIVLSVLSLGLIIDRAVFFSRRRVSLPVLRADLSLKLRRHDLRGARALLAEGDSTEGEILRLVLDAYDDGPDAVEEVLRAAVKERRKVLESGLLFLGTLGANAPFVGLLGTVLGIVTAFRELGAGAAGAMGNVMTGIAEALLATAVGIFVAIPAVVAFNWFQKKCGDIEENVAVLGHVVLGELKRGKTVSSNGITRSPVGDPPSPPKRAVSVTEEVKV